MFLRERTMRIRWLRLGWPARPLWSVPMQNGTLIGSAIFARTLVGVEGNDGATDARPGPEVAGDNSVESDVEHGRRPVTSRRRRLGGHLADVVEISRLDEAPPAASYLPLDDLVADVERHSIVFPVHDVVDDLEKMAAVDAGVAVTRM